VSVRERTASTGSGSLLSAALTGASTLLVTLFAAVVGVVIAREFGRTDETDGFFAAYGVFIVVVLAAQAVRLAVLPAVARARLERRLAAEISGIAAALAVVAVPMVVLAGVAAPQLGDLLTGGGSPAAAETAETALRWLVPAAAAHLFAGLAASGLAALDDYGTAAFGYAAGSAAGLTLILMRVGSDGIEAVSWGMTLNAAISLAVPLAGLAVRALSERVPRSAVRPDGTPVRSHLGAFAAAASLPIALQMLYVVCLPFAGRLGTGDVTSFGYAYLGSAALVAVTATSLGLVSSVPLARAGLGADGAVRHVVSTSWLALALVAAAAPLVAVAGSDLVEAVLGSAYAGDVGGEVGTLVLVLGPWIVASVGVSVAFPLAFVAERTRRLPLIGLAALAAQVPLAWAAWAAFELAGLALALAVSTFLVLAGLLHELGALRRAVGGLLTAAVWLGALAAVAFLPPALLLAPVVAALSGAALYVVLVAIARPRGLRVAWGYLRTL
jgi:O-antigen/teichoic acid export membrane protein